LRVAYFVHDLNDPGVARRLSMLGAARLESIATGFWRGWPPPSQIAGAQILPLSRTFDGRFVQRVLAVLKHAAGAAELSRDMGPADLFVARSLEMLALAVAVKRSRKNGPAIVFECADIHRLLSSQGAMGAAMRAVQRTLLSEVESLIVTSPAFLTEFFQPLMFGSRNLTCAVVENKHLQLVPAMEQADCVLPSRRPWRVGWFGMLRCRRSFKILSTLAQRRPDLVEVDLAGRPAQTELRNFQQSLRDRPGMRFCGSYAPCDLPALYEHVHFNWAIDYFEEAGNSRWLLPNRIYEGGSFNAVPFALRHTETGRWLKANRLGVLLDDPESELEGFLENLTAQSYDALKLRACSAPRSLFIADQAECNRLASILRDAAGAQFFPAPRMLLPAKTKTIDATSDNWDDVDVCICSYRRPEILETLKGLAIQENIDLSRMRIIVADNTALGETKTLILNAARQLGLDIQYVYAPADNISVARNACLDAARAKWIAFLDDDEVPTQGWLACLLAEARHGGWDAVLGPVDAIYPDQVPHWLRHGNFHSTRPVWRNGRITTAYTGNVVFRRHIVESRHLRFRTDLGVTGGEDEDFFYRFSDAGGHIGFAARAVVREYVEPSRANFRWLIRRSFRSGQTHGTRLREERRPFTNAIVALAKAGACMAGATISAASSIHRRRYLMRAALHCGAVARLLGIREFRMY
jgi:hypothetical protein